MEIHKLQKNTHYRIIYKHFYKLKVLCPSVQTTQQRKRKRRLIAHVNILALSIKKEVTTNSKTNWNFHIRYNDGICSNNKINFLPWALLI